MSYIDVLLLVIAVFGAAFTGAMAGIYFGGQMLIVAIKQAFRDSHAR